MVMEPGICSSSLEPAAPQRQNRQCPRWAGLFIQRGPQRSVQGVSPPALHEAERGGGRGDQEGWREAVRGIRGRRVAGRRPRLEREVAAGRGEEVKRAGGTRPAIGFSLAFPTRATPTSATAGAGTTTASSGSYATPCWRPKARRVRHGAADAWIHGSGPNDRP